MDHAEPVMRRAVRRLLRGVLGYGLAAACLVWLFYDVQPRALFAGVGRIRWAWVAAGVFFDVAGYVLQGWRWELLLRKAAPTSVGKTTQAIYAGLFANEVLPMRVGEILRGYLVARWAGRPLRAVVPSLVVERLMDGIWTAVAVGLIAWLMPLPAQLERAGNIVGISVLAATAVFLFLLFRTRAATPRRARSQVGRWTLALFASLEDGLRDIGLSREFWLALFATLLLLVSQILSFWFIMLACDLNLSIWAGAVVLLVVHVGTMIPNAPANLGTYQFSVVIGLELFRIPKPTATAFSFLVFFILTAPLWTLGLLALTRTGLSLGGIRRELATSRLSAPEIRAS